MRLGGGPAALSLLGLLAVVAAILDLGEPAAFGVGAVEDEHPVALVAEPGGDPQEALEGMLVPAVHGEAESCQPAADGAGTQPMEHGRLTQDLERVALTGQQQAMQEDGQGQAGPDTHAFRVSQKAPVKPLYGGSDRSNNQDRHLLGDGKQLASCFLSTKRCLFLGTPSKAQRYWL